MKKTTLLFAAVPFALAFIACDQSATSPRSPGAASRAVVLQVHSGTVGFSGFNSCNGDVLAGTGTVHQVIQETVNDNGFHLGEKLQFQNVKLTGTPSGASYVANQTVSLEENVLPGETITETFSLKIIGQGQADNLVGHTVFHVTVNANGDITSSFDKVSVDCH